MFTRCPACETTFRLGAGDLRRAQGRVRCGECSSVFNALAYLTEEVDTAPSESWLPEPANDALSPDETMPFPVRNAETGPERETADRAPEYFLDDPEDPDADPFETAIFVTEADDDGQYYPTRSLGAAADTPAPAAAEPASNVSPATPVLALPTSDEADEDGTAEFPITPDIYGGPDTEPDVTERWNMALQQHELAESGLDLTVTGRAEFLSPEELDEAADDDESLTVAQPALQAAADIGPAAVEEDFDDTIWERIPGVGAADGMTGRPIGIEPLRSPWVEEPAEEPGEDPAPVRMPADADDDSELLEFNAPEETWSRIFVRGSTSTPEDEDEGYPEVYADDPTEERAEYLPDDATDDKDDDADDMQQLERIFNPERIAAAMQERIAARSGVAATGGQTPAEDYPVSNDDDPERQEAMAVWLTDEAADDTSETGPDEFPAEGYDVQHIILADESEPANDGNEKVPAAPADATAAPLWPRQQEVAPRRSGLWLTGGLVLVAALAAQLLHYNRDILAASPVWGDAVSKLYGLAGMDLFPAWSLDDFEIRSAEAVTGESGADIMDIRAQVAAVGDQPTGYPYLRVVLSDRWSKPVAEKTFGPADYLAKDAVQAQGLMQPGQTIAAHVSIVDPGTGAQGFEIELCLPRRHTGMECTGQPFK